MHRNHELVRERGIWRQRVRCVMNLLCPAWHGLKVTMELLFMVKCDVMFAHMSMHVSAGSLMAQKARFGKRFHANKHAIFIHDLSLNEYLWLRGSSSSVYPSSHPHTWRWGGGRGQKEALQCHAAAVSTRNLADVSTTALNAAELLHKLCTTCRIRHGVCGRARCSMHGKPRPTPRASLSLSPAPLPLSLGELECKGWKVNTAALCNK